MIAELGTQKFSDFFFSRGQKKEKKQLKRHENQNWKFKTVQTDPNERDDIMRVNITSSKSGVFKRILSNREDSKPEGGN